VQLPIVRSFQTSTVSRDIDSAAKFIGAGAATVGVAGSGMYLQKYIIIYNIYNNKYIINISIIKEYIAMTAHERQIE